jgi:hypothetical protein
MANTAYGIGNGISQSDDTRQHQSQTQSGRKFSIHGDFSLSGALAPYALLIRNSIPS